MSTVPLRVGSFRCFGPVPTVFETFKSLPFADIFDQSVPSSKKYNAPILNLYAGEDQNRTNATTKVQGHEADAYQSFLSTMQSSSIDSALSAGRGSQRRRGSVLSALAVNAASNSQDAAAVPPPIIAFSFDSLPSISEEQPAQGDHELWKPSQDTIEDLMDSILREDGRTTIDERLRRMPLTEADHRHHSAFYNFDADIGYVCPPLRINRKRFSLPIRSR